MVRDKPYKKISEAQIDEIETLIFQAFATSSKKQALPFINRLKSIRSTLNMEYYGMDRYTDNKFSELICYAQEASGSGRNKSHWCEVAKRDSCHLQSLFREHNNKENQS